MSVLLGLYCSGWLKTGPTGVIATTMNNSFDTARSLVEDMDSGSLDVSSAKPGPQFISAVLEKRGTPLSIKLFYHLMLSPVVWPGGLQCIIRTALALFCGWIAKQGAFYAFNGKTQNNFKEAQ